MLRAALAAGMAEAEPTKAIYARIMLAAKGKQGITLTADEVKALSLDWAVSEAAVQGARETLLEKSAW